MGGQVALAGPHLVESPSNELPETHKGVGFAGGPVRVVGRGREGKVPVPQESKVGLLFELSVVGFDGRERGECLRQVEVDRWQTRDPIQYGSRSRNQGGEHGMLVTGAVVTCVHVPVTVHRSGVQDLLCLVLLYLVYLI
jgi:hypothetical protein